VGIGSYPLSVAWQAQRCQVKLNDFESDSTSVAAGFGLR
jgi:hypothetical protein